jgi:hypothetical protein
MPMAANRRRCGERCTQGWTKGPWAPPNYIASTQKSSSIN